MFVSDAAARRNFDASHKVRSLLLPPEAKNWLQRARGLERALVVRWANGG